MAVAAAAATALVFATSADGSTVEIGSVAQIDGNIAPNPGTTGGDSVQLSSAPGHSYVVPSGYGVITRFRHRTGTNSGPLSFQVYRPTGAAAEFTTIASESHQVDAGTVESFDTQIPVKPGDTLGLSAPGGPGGVQEGYTGSAGDQVGFFPGAPPVGGTNTASPVGAYFIDVAARIETDADADGYGDDTQDGCPTDASDHTACAADTVLTKTPAKKVTTRKRRKKVTFAFSSPQANVTFECSIDGAALTACTSPLTKKLRKGKHTFAVRAVNASGEPDASPATYAFKIKRKR
jgi:hypothetical protein